MQCKEIDIDGRYTILENGDVIGLDGKTILKGSISHKGYRLYRLKTPNGMRTFSAHRLVAWEFLDDYTVELQVDHKDRDKLNNNKSNLRMVTNSENQLYAIELGKKPANQKKVGKYSIDNVLIEEFDNGKLASLSVGRKDQSNVLRCCRGQRPTAFGFIWKFH